MRETKSEASEVRCEYPCSYLAHTPHESAYTITWAARKSKIESNVAPL
jgi:hypothetical protein